VTTTGETAAPGPGEETAIEAYTRTYQEHHSRLVAYARTLTGDAWLAEDLTAEAHFRVWRRISAGHQVDHIPGYLAATIRNLAVDLGHAPRELPQGDELERLQPAEAAVTPVPQEGAYAVMLAGALKQLPHRWVRALWLTEVEDWSLQAVGDDLGTNRNATAVLLHRAREGLRQAFLRAQPGAPDEASCAEHWERMPAHVRGTSSARQDRALRAHADNCPDCRARLALLERANHRLPALVGPALLLAFAGGAARYLVPAAGARAAARGHGAGRTGHAASSSGSASGAAGSGSLAVAGVAGGLVLAGAGAVAALALTLTGPHASTQSAALSAQRGTAPASQPASAAAARTHAPSPASSSAAPDRASARAAAAAGTAPAQPGTAAATTPSSASPTVPTAAPATASPAAAAPTAAAPTTAAAATATAASTSTAAAPTTASPSLPAPTTPSPTLSAAPTSPSVSPSPTVVATTPAPSTTTALPSTPAASPSSVAPTDPTCVTLGGLSVCWSR
jgi:RNA polymerase sigma factor (sigma-70 family)